MAFAITGSVPGVTLQQSIDVTPPELFEKALRNPQVTLPLTVRLTGLTPTGFLVHIPHSRTIQTFHITQRACGFPAFEG